jgi:hypothetical protein
MNCYSAKKDILLSIDGCLPPDRAINLEDHLNTCAECAEESSEQHKLQQIVNISGRELPDNFEWKLNLQLNRAIYNRDAYQWIEQSNKKQWYKIFIPYFASGITVAVLMAVLLIPGLFNNNGLPSYDNRGGVNMPSLATVSNSAGNNDRRTLMPQPGSSLFSRNQNIGNTVSSKPITDYKWERKSWSGKELEDLRTISTLRNQNRLLNAALKHAQLENDQLKELLQGSEDD